MRFLLLLAAIPATLAAQTKHPDFSGTWALQSSDNQPASAKSSTLITQTATKLTFEQSAERALSVAVAFSIPIDGSTSTGAMQGPNGPVATHSTARWEADTLVVETTADLSETTHGYQL